LKYYRHGTLSLYAALDTQSDKVLGKTAARHTLSRSGGNIPIRPAASPVTLSVPNATSSSQIVIVMRYVNGS
jgi:hypothetical protein